MFQIERARQIAGGRLREQEPMSLHTTFRIGGPAELFAEPESEEALIQLVHYCRETGQPWMVIGNGSNLLVSDEGCPGMIISTRHLDRLQIQAEREGKTEVEAGCGILLSTMAARLADHSLSGFEFAGGIPGTLGGAVTMNAGAYGGEIKDCILSARVMDEQGCLRELAREELKLSYRHSVVQEQNMTVLSARFAFIQGEREQIREQMREFNARRREKQPLEYGSAGSTFKRPEGYFAGKLIQDAGLRGYRQGDVMVSEKHCGFVVNVGQGTFQEAMAVIRHVQDTVEERFGVGLELEVKVIGR